MDRDARILKQQNFPQTDSDTQFEQQHYKPNWDISDSELKKPTLNLESQIIKIKTQNEGMAQAIENTEAAGKKYSALFENNPCGLFILSAKGVIIELNKAATVMLGLRPSLLVNRNLRFFISDGSKDEFDTCLIILFETQRNIQLDLILRKPDGSPVYAHVDASINQDKETCIMSASVIAKDKHEGKSLLIAEKKYRKLHESLMDGFVSVDMNGIFTESNNIYQSMLGYTAEEIKKLSYQSITPNRWHEAERKIIDEQVLVRGFSEVYEKEYRKKDGTLFPVELRTVLMRDENGTNTGMWAIVRDITRRKEAENLLKANEEKYRTLIDFAPDAFFQGDTEGNLIAVNNMAIELTGYSKADLLSMNLSDMIPDFIKKEKPLRYDLLKKGDIIKTERAILRKSGELVHIEMNSKAMPDGTYQCFARDISSRFHTEEILRESEERYRELADSITDDFCSMDEDLVFTYCNKSFADNSGIQSEDIIGKSIYEVFPDCKGSLRELVYLDVIKTKKPRSCIDELLIKGEKKYVEIKTYPSKRGLVVFIYDINVRMQTEKELTLFKSIIESSNAAVTVSDSAGTLMYVNQAYEKLFGRSFQEAVLLNLESYFPTETLKVFNDKIQPTLSQGIPWEGEIEVFHKNGKRIPVWAHAGSIRDTRGENILFFTILDDITVQKKAEKDKLNLELMKGEESERLRIAHDLHNHIGHIIIAIKIHIERAISSANNETNREQLELLLDKVVYALKEVRLVSSKLAGRFPSPLGINQQISTFLTDLEITCNLQIVKKIDPLPDKIPSALLKTIVGILEEALTNVLKHSGASRVYIHIFIKKNRIFINFRDNGNGITDAYDHHGSGLHFLQQEAVRIGGEISIKSVPGKFCMLKFNAPITLA